MTASPAFMSLVPQPRSRSPSRVLGTLSAIGTVSRWPARTTRPGRSRSVRASTALPTRSTSRPPSPRSAVSTASARRSSDPDTDGMSTSARVSARTSAERSRCGRVPTTAEPTGAVRVRPGRRGSVASCPVTNAAPSSAVAAGLATLTPSGTVLDTWFPRPRLGAPEGAKPGTTRLGALELSGELGPDYGGLVRRDEARGVEVIAVRTVIPDLSAPPVDTHDVWLRLHLLSHRLIQPHGANLTGIFGLLTNVAWTSAGPVEAAGFNAHRLRAAVGHVPVFGVNKFPRMVDYVIPSGVRIADGDRVRLGAHLAEGTTVMHEGFVNYNAGTLGPSMVEGRISAGVVVGPDSDIGGGSSIM